MITTADELGRVQKVAVFATEEEAAEEYLRLRHDMAAMIVEEDYVGLKVAPGEHFVTRSGHTVSLGEVEI